jgi:hypothetical protein
MRAQRALSEMEALRKVVEGLESLAGTRTEQPALFVETPTERQQAESGPRGQEAVRQVMLQAPDRNWMLATISREILRRGWIDPEAKVPQAAIRAAVQRLAAAGLVEKMGTGRYRLTERGRRGPVG